MRVSACGGAACGTFWPKSLSNGAARHVCKSVQIVNLDEDVVRFKQEARSACCVARSVNDVSRREAHHNPVNLAGS